MCNVKDESYSFILDEIEFDRINKSKIGSLLSVKDKCFYHEHERLKTRSYINRNNFNFIYYRSYFSLVRDICDLSLLFLINEEISNSINRFPYPKLFEDLVKEGHYKNIINVSGSDIIFKQVKIKYTINDLRELLTNKFNPMLCSHMFDFEVSMFSAFEYWISRLYEQYKEEFNAVLIDGRKDKYFSLIEEYNKASEHEKNIYLDKIVNSPGLYISFPDKLNCIFKKIDKRKYRRKINDDKKLVDFLRVMRNTVHNCGIHNGKKLEYQFNGVNYLLEDGKYIYIENHNDLIAMYSELTDIYSEILFSIDGIGIDSYTQCDADNISLNMLESAIKHYLSSFDEDIELAAENATKVMLKIGFDDVKTRKVIEFIESLRGSSEMDYESIFMKVLTHDLM